MNRHLHRVVFNAARGMRMVVQETATSTGKGASKATTAAGAMAIAGVLMATSAHAQIVGAPNVPGNLRPTVLLAPNGVPLVNIQTPSAAGVSRNVYNQFNVGANGAILNNSRVNVQTQLGGFVQGNPYLATGPARIILNEINGGSPSQLRGYIEVGGQRAEVIIANPAGISVDGGGFINASRATLTTGTPQFNAIGGLDSFLVRGGTVTIDGAGLDASKTDYAAILARAVQVNAGIWASELKVVTGANEISADHSQVTPTAGTGAAPAFALDVAALGGMYAGKIVLIGTEAGLGVRNAGTIQATPGATALAGAGQLVVTSAGRLENIGTIQGTADANLAATGLANSGRISSGGNLKIATQDSLTNSLNGVGGTLEGARVELASAGGDIDNRTGLIRQTSATGLALSAPALSNTNGGTIGLEPVAQATSQPDGGAGTGTNTGSSTGAGGGAGGSATSTGSGAESGSTITPAPYVPPSPGTITAAGTIRNDDGGRIYAGGPIDLQSANIKNNGGTLSVASMTVNQPIFSNQGGTLNVSNGFSANVGSFDNTGGKLNAGSLNIATSSDLINTDGLLASATDANLAVGGKAENTRGTIVATGALTASVAGATINNSGTLASNRGLTLNTGSLESTKGSIQSVQAGVQLAVVNQLVNGTGGSINAATDLGIQAGSLANSGSLRGANDVHVAVDGELTNDGSGSITAGHNTTITGGSVLGSTAGVFGAGIQNDGTVGAVGDLRVTTANALIANGTNIAAGNATLQGASVDLSGSQTSAANIAVTSTLGNVTTSHAKVVTPGTLSITAAKALSNTEGTVAADGATIIDAASLDNSSGTLASVKGDLRVTTIGATTNKAGSMLASGMVKLTNDGLDNTDGKVSGNSLSVDAHSGSLDNTRGTLAAATTLDLNTGALVNDAGLIQSGGAMTIDTKGAALTNTNAASHSSKQGGITSADTLTLKAGAVNNTAGFIGAKNALDAKIQGFTNKGGGEVLGQSTVAINTNGANYDNSGGKTLAVGNLGIEAGSITNAGGLIRSAATTALNSGSVTNTDTQGAEQGIEGKSVSITSASIFNKSGAIRADDNVALTSTAQIDNSFGLVSAGDTLTVRDPGAPKTLSVLNSGGTLVGGKNVVLDAGAVTWDGKLLSLGDMDLTVNQDITFAAGSQTVANNNLTLSTTGGITNNGKLAAGNELTLSAKDIDNTATGDIQGKTTTLNASGTVTNRGVIDGKTTSINAGTLNNRGTGRIYGDQISIGVVTLNNDAETVGGVASAGTIAARQRLDLGVTNLNNRDGALIFSDGDLAIGGTLVAGKASGSAGTVNNYAATIEASQNIDIKTSFLNNTNGGVTWTMQSGKASDQITEYALPGSATRYASDQLVFVTVQGPSVDFERMMGVLWPSFGSRTEGPIAGQFSGILVPSASYPLSRYKAYYTNPPRNSSDLHGTRQINIDFSEDFTEPGAWYSRTDPIWATFGVTPPATDIPTDSVQLAAYLDAHKRLDAATEAFIRDVYANYARSYYAWVYTESTTTPVLQTSSPARIIAGGKMDIVVGSGTNDMSQILANKALTVTGGTIENKNVEVSGSQNRTGWQHYQAGVGDPTLVTPYNTSVPITVTLAAARQEGNVTVVGSGTSTGILTPGHANQGVASASGVNSSGPGTGATGPIVPPIIEVKLAANSGAQQIVRTTLPGLTLPTASLFRTHAEASSRYLIETDPRFANYRNWLSSDYLLNNLGVDPNNTLKRLGDGYYEQRLVREQVAQLTGYRYLDGYDSDEKQYAALMDAGVTFARQYGLRPGIALTDAQMAQLTSDIVWLVEQTVTLPDGSTQRVLVPQVYVRVKNGDIDGSGALLAGKEVNIKMDGDLVNSGTVAGRSTVKITAENIQNLNGRISGGSLDLTARTDLNNIGGTIDAASQLKIEAGRDINVRTTTSSSGLAMDIAPGAASLRGATIVDRVAGLYVSDPKGTLVASAGRDVNLIGALIANSGKEGTTEIDAGRDINLGTVATSRQDATIRDAGNYRAEASTQEVGTRIEVSGDISLNAKRDVNVRAGTINSTDGALEVLAKRNINIDAGQSSTALNAGLQTSEHGFGGSESRKDQGTFGSTGVIGSSLGGKTVVLDAGNDIRIRGSNVVSDKGTELQAGNNVTIEAAQQTRDSQTVSETSRSGIFDASSGWTWGHQDMRSTSKSGESTAVSSTVGSISGNVTITAGNRYSQVGSDVTAPGGNIDIQARDVQIVEARESIRSESTQSFSQGGITLGFKAPLIDMIWGMEETTEAMGNTKDDRMKALGAASIGLSGYSAYKDIAQQAATQNPNGTGAVSMGATLTVGSSSSESTRTQSSDTSASSRVQAGGNVTITATGGGRDSNILVRGSQIDAGKNISLAADNNVTLEAATNTKKESSTSRSSNASIGVGVSFGETNGITLEVAAGSQSGRDNGTDGAWTNTTVKAGQQVSIKSGGDTTVRGAIVSGKRIEAEVGGNLRIETLQDTSTYHSDSSGGGFSGSFCIYACYGGSVSVGANNMHGDGDFASATQQSGFFAGDGGFGVSVRGNTTLVGAAISSKDSAVDEGRNSFTTGSLTMTDLVNRDTFKGSGYSFNISTSGGGGAGIGDSDIDRSSTTRSGISGIAGNTAIRTGVDGTNALQMTSRQRAMRDVQAQVLITSQFGSQAARAVGDYAEEQYRTLMRQANAMGPSSERDALIAEAAKWGESGAYRVAAHIVIGGLAGGAGGAAGAGAAAAGARSLNDLQDSMMQGLISAGLSPSAARVAASTLGVGFASVVGALAGGSAGAAGAYNTDANNRVLHPSDTVNAYLLAAQSGGKYTPEQIAEALRWSGVRDASGKVVDPASMWQSYDSATGQAYGSPSPTRTVSGDMVYDLGLRVVQDGYALREVQPGAPSRDLMNFIVQGTGGVSSPYVFDTRGMTYGPSNNSDNPQYFPCASTTCLVYGANWNPNNPTNQAQAEQGRNAVGAVGLIVGAPLVAAYGVPVLMGLGVTAQSVPLTGGVASVTTGKWLTSVGAGGGMGAAIEFASHLNTATPASLGMAFLGGSVGGPAKLSLNAYFGLANQWVPTTLGNFGTWYLSSQFAATPVREMGQSGLNVNGNTSWWNTPILGCQPSPGKSC
ncbi:filamentous hemagglutinin [Variovorax sp. YR752]|uniref:two-partner secretion domain-containing protein n=1 Tax=Variovorax sp. YR752 TaxID=1884383 RepID=UPI000BDD9BF4|nr:hemagglutinin repeat-containing protein [Variovorax sp. YR752]SOD28921.1 filamentous hemagglutinin [Variovorax sp. YR752]